MRHLSLPLVSPESDSKVFNQIIYLGAATINAPRSQTEIQRNMKILHEQSSDQAIEVKLTVPTTSEGSVVLVTGNILVILYHAPLECLKCGCFRCLGCMKIPLMWKLLVLKFIASFSVPAVLRIQRKRRVLHLPAVMVPQQRLLFFNVMFSNVMLQKTCVNAL